MSQDKLIQLQAENAELQARLEEAQDTLRAIRTGGVDALVVAGPKGEQIYTLKGADEPYRVMVEEMTEGAVTFSPDGTIHYCNARFAQLLGATLERTIGSALQRFVAPHELRTLDGLIERLHETQARSRLDLQRDGTILPVLFSARILKIDQLEVIAAVVTDLSDVVAAAEAKARLALIVESSDDAIISTALDGVVQTWNAGAERLFGYSAAEAVGTPLQQLIVPPERSAEFAHILDEARRGGPPGHMETVCRRKGGRLVDISLSRSPILDMRGNVVGASAIVRDITERKRAEEELRSASLYARSLIEASLDPLVTISADGKITDVNEATVQATGMPRRALIGSDFSNYFTEPDQARAGYQEVFAKGFVTDYPLALRHVSGKVMEVLYNASLFRNKKGEVAGVLAAARDVTERKRLEAQVRQHQEHLEDMVKMRTGELEAANKVLEGFAYSVSHDLRVPLRAVDGFSSQLLKHYQDKLDDEGKRYLNLVRDNAKRMAQLIDDILAFSRAQRQSMLISDIDMEALVHEVLEELAPSFAGRSVNIGIKSLPACRGDRQSLRRVWANLLGNALKFTRPKAAADIEVGGHPAGVECIYYVRDNGVGYDMQYADKLFGVFQRLHGVEEFEGTGIGLALVKLIVSRHGGRVWAEGRVNEGATLYFALPSQTEKT